MRTIALLLLLAVPVAAQESAVILDLTGAKPGTYLLTIDAQGVVKAVPLRVYKLVSGPVIPPPPPSDPTAFEKAIANLAKAAITSGGSKTTGAAIGSVYSLVSSGVLDGSIAPEKAFEAVKRATDTVLAIQPDGAKWATFRTEVGKALTALATDGSLTTKAQIAAALQSIANGMKEATGVDGSPAETLALDPAKAGILEGLDLAKLIELIKIIIELLKAFS
jgi:hypothetical protein